MFIGQTARKHTPISGKALSGLLQISEACEFETLIFDMSVTMQGFNGQTTLLQSYENKPQFRKCSGQAFLGQTAMPKAFEAKP